QCSHVFPCCLVNRALTVCENHRRGKAQSAARRARTFDSKPIHNLARAVSKIVAGAIVFGSVFVTIFVPAPVIFEIVSAITVPKTRIVILAMVTVFVTQPIALRIWVRRVCRMGLMKSEQNQYR